MRQVRLCLFAAITLTACERAEQAQDEARAGAERLRAELTEKVKTATSSATRAISTHTGDVAARARGELEALSAKIDALKARIAQSGANVQSTLRAELDKLMEKRRLLTERLLDLEKKEKLLGGELDDMSKALDQLDAQALELRAKAKAMTGDAQRKINDEVAEVQRRREELAQRLAGLRAQSTQALSELSEGLDDAISELGEAYEKARAQFN